MTAPIVTGLRQVALASAAPAQLAAFYGRALGLKVLFESGGMVFLDAGPIRLMIGPKHPEQAIGGDVICYFEPVDWVIAEASVAQAGGVFVHDTVVLQQTEGRELALRAFRDPEGHALALLGWRASG